MVYIYFVPLLYAQFLCRLVTFVDIDYDEYIYMANNNTLNFFRPTTPAPPDIFIPPIDSIPPVQGGGGVVEGIHGAGGTGVGGPPLIGGPGGTFPGGASLYVPGEPVPLASALVGAAAPPLATGTRAGAVVGTVLGTLAFLTSLMWGLYKMKPGVPSFLSPGAASAAGGPVSITAPRATSNLAAVQAAGGAGGGGAGGAGATKLTVVNGAASGKCSNIQVTHLFSFFFFIFIFCIVFLS